MELGKAEEIAEVLRDHILNGTLQPGTKITSERELSEEYGASRMTARKALQILEGDGLVARYPVRGTFVAGIRERLVVDKGREMPTAALDSTNTAENAITAAELRHSGSFLKDMERIGRKPRVQFLEQPSLIAATEEIAAHLQIKKGAIVLKRHRLQSADNLPYRLIESYYPGDLFSELLTMDIEDKPLFVWLQEEHGFNVVQAQEILTARLATQVERQLLQISPNAPVMSIERTVFAETKRPVEWARILANAALYTFSYEYDISDWSQAQPTNGSPDQTTPTANA